VGKTQIVYELAERVTSDIIVFTDADILLARDGVQVIVDCMADPTIAGVIGTIAYRDTEANAGNTGQGKYLELENTLRRCESLFWTTVGPDGECFAVKRGSYRPLRDYRLSDDLNLVITIPSRGRRVWYEPALRLQEINRRSLTTEYRRRLRMGQQAAATLLSYHETRFPWRSLVGFQIWSHKLLRNLAAIPMALAVVTSILLAILRPDSLFFTVAAALAILWGVALLIGLVGERLSFKFRPLQYPLYFTSMLTSLTIGSMRAVFSGGLEMWTSPRE
jgi:cellulose synthase/poly-beta-1,6-N-acetylglucosamine synthase-like glycosyltransferase